MTEEISRDAAGGGSGGGDGDKSDTTVGSYVMTANRIEFITRVPMAANPTDLTPAVDTSITLLATGKSPVGAGSGGLVELRGNQGVRITSGPPLLTQHPTSSSATAGIEAIAFDTQSVTIQQGITPISQQTIMLSKTGIDASAAADIAKITLKQGTIDPTSIAMSASGIAQDAGKKGSMTLNGLTITLEAATTLTLQLKGGAASVTLSPTGIALSAGGSSLTLDPTGIVLKGLKISLN